MALWMNMSNNHVLYCIVTASLYYCSCGGGNGGGVSEHNRYLHKLYPMRRSGISSSQDEKETKNEKKMNLSSVYLLLL